MLIFKITLERHAGLYQRRNYAIYQSSHDFAEILIANNNWNLCCSSITTNIKSYSLQFVGTISWVSYLYLEHLDVVVFIPEIAEPYFGDNHGTVGGIVSVTELLMFTLIAELSTLPTSIVYFDSKLWDAEK